MEHIERYFDGVAWKYLSAVDSEPKKSNQHEIGGLVKAGFKKFLGDPASDKVLWPTKFLYLADDEDQSVSVTGFTSWYDSRRRDSKRPPELRLHYESNAVTELISAGMFMVIAKAKGEDLLLVFTEAGSSAEQQLRWLFGLQEDSLGISAKSIEKGLERSSWAAIWILDQLEVETRAADETWLDTLLERFGPRFPTTADFSSYARGLVMELDACSAPDSAIVSLMETEERLFRLLERHIVEKRLESGFDSVDDFVQFSLSVQNRRKSRAGYAFENHLEFIFLENSLLFERGAYTENRSRPDFLFPGSREYHEGSYPTPMLSMLGVKSSCKERWRQVLAEATRIEHKHLATLEPAISSSQLAEMQSNSLQLVVPTALHETYSEDDQRWLFSISDFIAHVKAQQAST